MFSKEKDWNWGGSSYAQWVPWLRFRDAADVDTAIFAIQFCKTTLVTEFTSLKVSSYECLQGNKGSVWWDPARGDCNKGKFSPVGVYKVQLLKQLTAIIQANHSRFNQGAVRRKTGKLVISILNHTRAISMHRLNKTPRPESGGIMIDYVYLS